ncbi:propionyl-CoA synthetase [Egibacter rhizosphaerae]|uniref:Propionyl-CoA synthetase n=1 Tax=Egibacter rhizosphaerae TaxID=1670831 RepID=A0A411YC52_9ACTN|nr:propionyl-CoA synthetase [Egibacter rhizosphaerae]QBI18766.1 propionyl-CoA synthetase [Egibacter rhizosphaerae]
MSAYARAYHHSMSDPEGFWGEAAAAIEWTRRPTRILDREARPAPRWFANGELNTCYNAVDRHVEAGRGDQLALIHDSPLTGRTRRFTYTELRDDVARFAGALAGLGVSAGDRVLIYLPMVPEAAVAMLACARLGAIHSVVFGGFAARELAVRIDDARPVAVVAASCGVEPGRVVPYMPLVERALEQAEHTPDACVVLQREEQPAELTSGRDHDWEELAAAARPVGCTPVAATDPLYVLYTSGTTAKPKGVVRDNGGHAVALRWSMTAIYDTGPGEVFWAASDVGWVVGHSYIVYAPLLAGCTTVMYEGKPVGTPDAGAFWRVVDEHGVKTLFTAPTAFRAIKKEDPSASHLARYDLSRFSALFLAGERLDPDTYDWAAKVLDRPVIDHWWQTETGWPVAANPLGLEPLPIKPGSPTKPMPGWDVRILDDEGKEVAPGREGAVAVRLPLPPGALPTLWNDDDRFVDAYLSRYPGYYLTGDGGLIDQDGYLFIMGRIDDVLNVAGHRLSTGAMEAALGAHPAVAECAVIGVADDLKGEAPVGFVVLSDDAEVRDHTTLEQELVALVREEVGPVAAFKRVVVVDRLPKTRSGKILRRNMREIADGQHPAAPSTIEDPAVLEEVATALGGQSP